MHKSIITSSLHYDEGRQCLLPYLFDGLQVEQNEVQQSWSSFCKYYILKFAYFSRYTFCNPYFIEIKKLNVKLINRFNVVLQIGKIVHLSFRAHEKSAVHREAVDVMITLSSTTRDVGEQLS